MARAGRSNNEANTESENVLVAELDGSNEYLPDNHNKEENMTETSIIPQVPVGGQTVIDDQVIGAIAGTAAQEVDGVSSLGTSSVRRAIAERLGTAERRARGVGVVAGQREAILDIEINVMYGASIPDVVNEVRDNVSNRVMEMCGLVTKEVNINVVGIEFAYGHPSRYGRVE